VRAAPYGTAPDATEVIPEEPIRKTDQPELRDLRPASLRKTDQPETKRRTGRFRVSLSPA
jgi:hypothetical protein